MPINEYVVKEFTIALSDVISNLLNLAEPQVLLNQIESINVSDDSSYVVVKLKKEDNGNPKNARQFAFTKKEFISQLIDPIEIGLEPDDLAYFEIDSTTLIVKTRPIFVLTSEGE